MKYDLTLPPCPLTSAEQFTCKTCGEPCGMSLLIHGLVPWMICYHHYCDYYFLALPFAKRLTLHFLFLVD